ncbi:tetratricopeptide repeat protein [Engelhardtia mirabilis]
MLTSASAMLTSASAMLTSASAMVPTSTSAFGGQAVDKTETELREDIDFARGLAADWQFIDLAESVLEGLASSKLDRDLRQELELARCEVYGAGARYSADPNLREQLFVQALDSYRNYIDNNERSPVIADAKRSYVDLGAAYIASMEMALEDAVGEEATRIRETLADRLEELLQYAGEQVAELNAVTGLTERERQELAKLMLYRAQMALTYGRLGDDYSSYLDSAATFVEDLTFAFGSTSGWGLSAYLVLGDVYKAQGAPADAADMYVFVVDTTIPFDRSAWSAWIAEAQPSQARLDGLWYFVELGTPKLIEAQLAAGDAEGALTSALHFQNTWRREGFNLSPQGYLAMLSVARTLLDVGGFLGGDREELAWFESYEAAKDAGNNDRRIRPSADLALELAGLVNEQNVGNTLQIRAQRLIADAIGRPGVEVDLTVLFEAAKGYYNSQDYDRAIGAFRSVMAAAKDETARRLHYPKVLWYIGRSFQRLDRQLEAAMAFREGIERWSGDAEYDAQNANGYYSAMQLVRRTIKDDQEIERRFREAESYKASLGDNTDIVYTQAMRAFDEKDFDFARETFQQVESQATNYEKSLVKAARCFYETGKLDQALAELDAYLQNFVADPRNRLGPTETARQAARDEATAEAVYFQGQIAWDQGRHADVVKLYGDFADRFPGQSDLAAATLYYCIQSSLELDDLAGAKRFEQRLVKEFPTAQWTGNGATRLFNHVADARDRALQAGDVEVAKQMLREMASYLEISNSLATTPSFRSLLQEARLWRDLGEWSKAEVIFAGLARDYANSSDAQEAGTIESSVIPDLALCLIEQRRSAEALELLVPLVPDPEDKEAKVPAQATIETFCRAVAGWVEGDPSNPTIVPGVGDAAQLDRAGQWWRKISNRYTKWLDCDWYQTEFNRAWNYYQYSKLDSEKLEVAKQIVRVIKTETGSSFALVEDNCDDDPRVRDLFRWLDQQL